MALWKKKEPVAAVPEPAPSQAPEVPKKRKNKQDDSRRERSEMLRLRLTPTEKAYIAAQARAAGMTVTDYLVICSEQMPVVFIPGVPELVNEMRRQGTNINQLAKMANATGDTREIDLRQAAAELRFATAVVIDFCQQWSAQIVDVYGKEDAADGHSESESQ